MVRPYDLYIRFLVTLGLDDLAAVNGQLAELDLYPIDEAEFNRHFDLVHKNVPKPVSNQITRKKPEGEFLRWMNVLEIGEIWQLEKPFRTAENAYLKLVRDINYDPQLRMTLRALLTKGVKTKDIVQTMNLKFSYMLKEEHVELYMKFFWDSRKMTRAAWRSYLSHCDEREKAIMFTVLTESLDVVKTYLDLPSQISISDALQYLFTSSLQKAKHYLRLNNKESNAEAREWIKHTVVLADKYEKHRTGNVEDFGKSLQLEFDYLDTEFPSPDENTVAELKAKAKAQQEAFDAKEAADNAAAQQ